MAAVVAVVYKGQHLLHLPTRWKVLLVVQLLLQLACLAWLRSLVALQLTAAAAGLQQQRPTATGWCQQVGPSHR
jgi:hypothetical protein